MTEQNPEEQFSENQKYDNICEIDTKYADPNINIALDTINKKKQAIFFVNTKPSAEKLAEEISKKIKDVNHEDLAESVLKVVSSPTPQCKRLANIIKRGIAFHHAGLVTKQRELIEDNFRKGKIRVICSTPTLAIGLDLPAFRTIIRDLKRYGGRWGMQDIPVLEYQQMAGRAGRPSYDGWGEAITISKNPGEAEKIEFDYIKAPPEDIYSKLAVEPVLRTYILSLVSSGFVKSRDEIIDFFSKTFWARQYQDMHKLNMIIDNMLKLLEEWDMLRKSSKESNSETNSDFVSADSMSVKDNKEKTTYRPTSLGKRVAELYLDPYTGHLMVTAFNDSEDKEVNLFSILHLICSTLEIRPLLRIRTKEYDEIQSALARYSENLLFVEPSMYDLEYDEFLSGIKTSMLLQDWCDEKDDEYLFTKYNVRPGELRGKIERGDWLLYSAIEISRILDFKDMNKKLQLARTRLKYGVKEELLPLLKLKGIGRIKARKLFFNKMHDISAVRRADLATLSQIIGRATTVSVKEQLGEEVPNEPTPMKRKGQMGLNKYT